MQRTLKEILDQRSLIGSDLEVRGDYHLYRGPIAAVSEVDDGSSHLITREWVAVRDRWVAEDNADWEMSRGEAAQNLARVEIFHGQSFTQDDEGNWNLDSLGVTLRIYPPGCNLNRDDVFEW